MKIAVDTMGGDFAPEAIVEGAVQAAKEYGSSIILVGQENRIHKELEKYDTTHFDIEVKHASQIVDMHDQPSFALRRKRDSSMHIAIYLMRDGQADAAVSAGNTGAGMAIGKVACRMLEGIDRPALATVLPNINGITVVIDVGANVDCKPIHLLQFAVMGHVYAKEVHGIEHPRIGLLSIGEEESKGNVLTKEVFEQLSKSPLNFIGNAEGCDVFNGRVDVVVCDGFIGNVVLKVSESLAKTIGLILKEGFTKNLRTKLGYLLVKSEMETLKKRTDYAEYGGAPLLGLNGVVIISHGRSKAKAIKNAIRVADESVQHHLNDHITEMMVKCAFDLKSRAKMTLLWRQFKKSLHHEESDTSKERQEKKEEPEQTEQPQVAEHPLAPELKPEEAESGKKPWWKFKESPPPASEKVELPALDQEEPTVKAYSQIIEQPSVSEVTPEKPESVRKSWWKFKDLSPHEGEKEEERSESIEISGEQTQVQKTAQLLEVTQDQEFTPAPEKLPDEPEPEPEAEKRHWWQPNESKLQDQGKEKNSSEKLEASKPNEHVQKPDQTQPQTPQQDQKSRLNPRTLGTRAPKEKEGNE